MTENPESAKSPKNRYQILEELGKGGMGAVYRVLDRLSGLHLALKEVKTPTDQLDFSTAKAPNSTLSATEVALANEFSTLASLRHPNIISVLDYGFDDKGQPFFTMDLVTGAKRINDASHGQSYPAKIQLILQMLQALVYLHRRQIIHRDLKPENVLVTADGTVKVLDFGLAISAPRLQAGGEVMGTLAYLAPEVLQGEAASVASDLYAVGIMIYEIVQEAYPYKRSTLTQLIHEIVNTMPDLTVFDDDMRLIMNRLLSKDPQDRYANAESLMLEICEATQISYPEETLAIRESFLQASTFVGRADELQELDQHLLDTFSQKGKTILIAGESGVGKSRLLNEFRVQALVQTSLVLRGQALSEASPPYELWRDVLRWLLLYSNLDMNEASILKDILPDIEQILGKNVAKAPEVSPQAAKERLSQVILNLFRQQKRSMLVILEDLQWAGQESLDLLIALTRINSNLPVLFVASYRSDESPNLANQIPEAMLMRLERLASAEISQLSTGILGDVGKEPKILAFLEGESAGNVFFVVEIIRALALEAGDLRRIAEEPLPKELLAGGVLAILQRRLRRVPESYRPLLLFAALIGRELDRALLVKLAPELDLEAFFLACSEIAVIEAQESAWRFSHDKLREALIREVRGQGETYQKLHVQVAESIESVYAENPSFIPALAHHWGEADNPQKASDYLEKASVQMHFWAYDKAIAYMEKAMTYDNRLPVISKARQLQRYSILAVAYYGIGDNLKAAAHYQNYLKQMGRSPIPDATWRVALYALGEVAVQARNRFFPKQFVGIKDNSHFNDKMYYALINFPAVFFYQGKTLHALLATLIGLNYVEEMKFSRERNPAMQYGILTLFSGLLNLHSVARHYYRLSESLFPESSPAMVAQSQAVLGFYAFQTADWDMAESAMRNVVAVLDEVGELHSRSEAQHMLANILIHRGKFEEAYQIAAAAYESTAEREDRTIQFLLFLTLIPLALDMKRQDIENFRDYDLLFDETQAEAIFQKPFAENKAHRPYYYSLRARLHDFMDNRSAALSSLERSIIEMEKVELQRSSTFFNLYAERAALCHKFLQSESLSLAEKEKLAKFHERCLKDLKSYAASFTFAQARALIHEAKQIHMSNAVEAEALWRKALERAEALQLPFDQALAHQHLGQLAHLSPETLQHHSSSSQEIFERIGANAYLPISNED